MRLRILAGLLAAAAFLPREAAAQALRVNLLDSASAAPVRGALVALVDGDGRTVTEVLSSPSGFGSLTAPAGMYRLRVRRIGYEPYTSGPLALPRADLLTVAIPAKPIVLTSVVISARSRCGPITSEAGGLGTVWDEVAKALQASRLSTDDLRGVGGGWTYRKTTGNAGEIEASDTSYFTIRNQRPFGAIDPARLARVGYVEGDETSGWSYYGPDETVLLSPEFAETHCFKLERDDADPGLIGISFRPVPSRRSPDIAGIAWVDRASSELRRIAFRYVDAGVISRFGGGGETRFQRLASGAWLVSAWHLRAPRVERLAGLVRRLGYHENGGGLLSPEAFQAVRAAERAAAGAATAASIDGVLLAESRPMAGAEVTVTATGQSARSDSAGRFRFAGVPAGFVHVRARALGFAFADTVLMVEKGRSHSIALTLVKVAPRLETVVVEGASRFGKPARYAGTSKFDLFYERRARGRGTFFTLEDIRRMDRARAIDLLGAVPGVVVHSPGGVPTIRVARCGTKGSTQGGEDARWLAVFINGQRVANGLEILAGLHPGGIEAMEVYRGAAQLPSEALGDACAAIFVWTRFTPDSIEEN